MTTIIKPTFKRGLSGIRVGPWLLLPPLFLVVALFSPRSYSLVYFLLLYSLLYGIFLWGTLSFVSATYRRKKFTLTTESLSYQFNFLGDTEKEVLLRNVKEIELIRGIIQKRFGLGTITIYTQASIAGSNQTGLKLSDIEDSEAVYQLLKERVSVVSGTSAKQAA